MLTSSPITTLGLAPEALDVNIEGTPKSGQLLTGHYRYNDKDLPSDPEDTSISGTQFEWHCSRSSSKKILATTKTYTIKDADMGCEISFNVTPHSQSGIPNMGAQIQSNKINVTNTIQSLIIRVSNDYSLERFLRPAFNMEIDYAHLGHGTPTFIELDEHIRGNKYVAKYKIGDQSAPNSTVTDDGSTIKFVKRANGTMADTANFTVKVTFQDGTAVSTNSPSLILIP